MNFKNTWSCCTQVMASIVLTQAFAAQAAAPVAVPNVFTFGSGYRVDAPTPRNIVEYGVIKKCGTYWCVNVERYDSAKLLPRVPTKYTHEMKDAPYGDPTCLNGAVYRVAKDVVDEEKTKIQLESDGISFQINDLRYHWVVDEKVANGYTLAEIVSDATRRPLDQSVGFAFSSRNEFAGDVLPAQVAAKYKGEIYAKTALTKVDGQWDLKPSIIDFRRFHVSDGGALLSLTEPGLPAIVQKYGGRPMWVQNSIVLARERGAIAPLIQEYGHDFNRDGCFNEPGHNKMMLPIPDENGGVQALIYIEYTSDFLRKFPMMSVGRYYR